MKPSRSTRARVAVAIAVAVAGCDLTGCSSEGALPGSDSSAESVSSESPGSGWADVLRSAYDEATAEAVREALSDGSISDLEYAYFQQQIIDCLSGLGVKAQWADDKSLEYTKPPGVPITEISRCNKENGLEIIALRDAMARNPQKLDENEIIVDCLRRAGAVDSSFTPEMLASENGLDKIGSTDTFDECSADPLHFGRS